MCLAISIYIQVCLFMTITPLSSISLSKSMDFDETDLSNAHHKVMASHALEDGLGFSKPQQEKRVKPPPLNCPRCDSTNTKFCYYNNYSLTQPRYFCKACKRYWTQGGSLRNVPIGGGCKKNHKKSSSSSSKRVQDQTLITTTTTNNSNQVLVSSNIPPLTYDSLAFSRFHNKPICQFGFNDHDPFKIINTTTPTTTTNTTTFAFLDALRSGILDTQSEDSHNLYYGFGNADVGNVTNGATTTTATIMTTTREESCRGRDGDGDIRGGFGNFPWQIDGEESVKGVVDPGRECWNGVIGSSWQGLVNNPLM